MRSVTTCLFSLAFSLGVFGYSIFLLGIFGLLTKPLLFLASFLYSLWLCYYYAGLFSKIQLSVGFIKHNKLVSFLFFLFILQVIVTLIGVLGPELAFDALWYHLTLPKIYLSQQTISFIPGGLLYYSTMPKLSEFFYVVALTFGNEITAKFIHFLFGIISCLALFFFSKRYVSTTLALLAVVIFYGNLVVGWLSITAYIDLARTFFELMALWGFILWEQTNKKKWLLISGSMVGLAISTKMLAFASLVVFLLLMILYRKKIQDILQFVLIAISIPLPWFIFSFVTTGNPFYPFFSSRYPIGVSDTLFSIQKFIGDIWILFTQAADPISPLYIALFPLLFIYYKKFSREEKIIALYSLFALLLWYFTPRTGGGRFIVPYLPAFSLLAAILIALFYKEKKLLGTVLICCVILISLISLCYRGIANSQYLGVIMGQQTKDDFLISNLNFTYGDFYDTDGYLKKNITKNDRVLLYGFHNLYYINFPFVDSSWVQKGSTFTHIATQNTVLPKRFSDWQLLYKNPITQVNVYTKGEKPWVY